MLSLRQRKKRPSVAVPAAGLSENVAGIDNQIDQLVKIIQSPSRSSSERITASEVVRSYVDFQSLSSITEIWYSVACLLELENSPEVRRAGWKLTKSCISRDELNNSAFTAYYAAIVRHSNVEDFDMVISCLDVLTNSGRFVVGSQAPRQLPSVLIGWSELLALRAQALRSNHNSQDIALQWGVSTEENFYSVMQYTISLLKFKMSIWEPSEIEKLLLVTVAIVRQTSKITDCQLCCKILQTVMAFGLVPSTVLQPILEVLCGMAVMVPSLKETCVSCIQALSRSHLQNSTFVRLCRILDSPSQEITLSMRSEAAVQLKDLATDPRDLASLMRSDTPSASRQGSPAPDIGYTDNSSSIANNAVISSSAGGNGGGNLLGNTQVATLPLEMEMPIVEVLESYYRTLKEPATPLRLVVTLLDCFSVLIIDFELLKRIASTTWIWPTASEEWGECVTPLDMVDEFSKLYKHMVKQDLPQNKQKKEEYQSDLTKFKDQMVDLAKFLASQLLEKSLNISTTQHILLCTRISYFMDTESCEVLLSAVEFLQFCTPGIPGWFDHLQEIMSHIYSARTDSCRAHVLRIVKNVFALDLELDSDWITLEQLVWITNTTFKVLKSTDSETLTELLLMYENMVFTSDISVFKMATSQLGEACIHPSANTIVALPSRIIDTLTSALASVFRLRPEQALVLLNQFVIICKRSRSNPDVFARGWAVLSRIRCNRWDQLVIVDHRVEESYGKDLLGLQEQLPKQLQQIHSQSSLVLKIRNADTVADGWPYLFDYLPIVEIMNDIVSSNDTSERNFALVLINAVPIVAHFRVMQSVASDEMSGKILSKTDITQSGGKESENDNNHDDDTDDILTVQPKSISSDMLPLLQVFRDTISSFISSGGAKFPCKEMTSSRRTACLCVIVHVLTVLLPYSDLYTKPDRARLIHIVVQAMGQWNLSTKWATHLFIVACYQAHASLQRYLSHILSRLQLKITSRDSSMYILDFLLSVSLEGSLTNNFNEQDFKRLFGMCFSFIQNTKYQLVFTNKGDISAMWLLRLAYSSICQLFLSMRMETRRALVPYIVRSLILANDNDKVMDPNILVVYDMITRFTYSDMPLRANMDSVRALNPSWDSKRWLWNTNILEVRCNRVTGDSILIIRRPAGIFTVSLSPAVSNNYDPAVIAATVAREARNEAGGYISPYQGDNYTANFFLLSMQIGLGALKLDPNHTASRPKDEAASTIKGSQASSSNQYSSDGDQNGSKNQHDSDANNESSNTNSSSKGSGYNSTSDSNGGSESNKQDDHDETGPFPGDSMPLPLPDDAATNRAIGSIDRVPILDFYKIGIIYCAPGQRSESEILANQCGSYAYRHFLSNIGTLIKLKNNRQYYVGGLDTEQDLDGEYAIAWSSRISQIIFHTTTMMPTYEGDTAFASKKRHIGNNFVNIYFDESGEDFEFDVVKSQFNFINIVITPTYSRGEESYWKLRVLYKPGMQNTSAAYDLKIISEENVSLFVRNLAIKLSLYASIHNAGGDYTDNWVYRLQLINTLKERVLKQAEEQAIESKKEKEADNDDNANDDVPTSFLNDDDYGDEENVDNSGEMEALRWADFSQYTK